MAHRAPSVPGGFYFMQAPLPNTPPPASQRERYGISSQARGSSVKVGRVVLPEWLDELPPDHPDALGGRRDLRRINTIMGNFRWVAGQVAAGILPGERVVEIGAGDGGLAARICRIRPTVAAQFHALDIVPRPASLPQGVTWHQTSLWSAEAADLLSGAAVVFANMVLHHFQAPELRRLGDLLCGCRMIVICEPSRRRLHLWQGRALFPLLNRVTRHDMIISIRAGFRPGELASSFGPGYEGRAEYECETWLGACRAVFRGPFSTRS